MPPLHENEASMVPLQSNTKLAQCRKSCQQINWQWFYGTGLKCRYWQLTLKDRLADQLAALLRGDVSPLWVQFADVGGTSSWRNVGTGIAFIGNFPAVPKDVGGGDPLAYADNLITVTSTQIISLGHLWLQVGKFSYWDLYGISLHGRFCVQAGTGLSFWHLHEIFSGWPIHKCNSVRAQATTSDGRIGESFTGAVAMSIISRKTFQRGKFLRVMLAPTQGLDKDDLSGTSCYL